MLLGKRLIKLEIELKRREHMKVSILKIFRNWIEKRKLSSSFFGRNELKILIISNLFGISLKKIHLL